MANVVHAQFRVLKEDTCTFLARIEDHAGTTLTQAATSAIAYTVFLVDDDDPDGDVAVSGHDEVAVTVADSIFDTLQTDDRWSVDTTGYNFRHTIDISGGAAFAIRGRKYRVVFTLTPADTTEQAVKWAYFGTVI